MGLGRHDLEHAQRLVFVSQGNHQDRANAQIFVCLLRNPWVGKNVVTTLKLAGADTDPGEAGTQLQARCHGADLDPRHEVLAFD